MMPRLNSLGQIARALQELLVTRFPVHLLLSAHLTLPRENYRWLSPGPIAYSSTPTPT